MKNVKSIALSQKIIAYQIDKLAFVLVAMFCLPLLFHLIPQSPQNPLGAVWLPIFYAPLVAVICFKRRVAVLAAIISPALNMILTGMPSLSMARMLTFELVVFVLIAQLIFRINKRFWALGAVSYLVAKFISTGLFQISSLSFSAAIMKAAFGITTLLVIGLITIQYKENKG